MPHDHSAASRFVQSWIAETAVRSKAEAKALDEIRAAAVDVAIAAAREVIVSEMDERRGAAMLDAAIAALPQRLR